MPDTGPRPRRTGALHAVPVLLALAACTADPPPVPPDLAARLDAARERGWPDVCHVPPPEAPGLSTAEVRARLEQARERAQYEAAMVRFRAGLRALPPQAPAAPRGPAATPAPAPAPPPLVETGVGETVRTETASGSLSDFLLWLEGALPAPADR